VSQSAVEELDPSDTQRFRNRHELKKALRADIEKSGNSTLSDGAIEDSEKSYLRQTERVAGAERRATTLQGFVSLAVTFVLANGGLLLGATGVRGQGWRVTFGAVLLAVAAALIVSALLASRAVFTTRNWSRPHAIAKVRERMKANDEEARLELVAALLYAAQVAGDIAQKKIDAMKQATVWFRIGLVLLLALAALFLAYVISSPAPSPPSAR
jgi:hypothetical protein